MARKEQKLTAQSPLPLLAKPGAMRQDTMPGFPVPHDTSPFSMPRLAYILRRGVESIKPFRDRLGRRWHGLKTEQPAQGMSSSLSWGASDGEIEVTTVNTLRGKAVTMTQEGSTAIFTNEAGATIKYHSTGASTGSPFPLRREAVRETEKDTPWYSHTAEAVGRAGIRVENIPVALVDAPTRTNTGKGVPVVRFQIALVDAPGVKLTVDAYNDMAGPHANRRRIERTLSKKLQPGEHVALTGQFHVDRLTQQSATQATSYERRWVRLIDVDRLPSPPTQ